MRRRRIEFWRIRLPTDPSAESSDGSCAWSGEDLAFHFAVDIGQAEVAAAVAIGQLLMIESHEVQDRGMQVVIVDTAGNGAVAEVVGGAVHVALLDAAAREPHGETEGMVIAGA